MLTPKHEPWLFDLKKDPNELVNQVMNPEYHEVLKNLAEQLLSYGKQRSDDRINNPFIRGDLAWATGNADAYPTR